jgi:hypothetical protein
MEISFCGLFKNRGDSPLLAQSEYEIDVDKTGLTVTGVAEHPNSRMPDTYTVKVRLTRAEIADFAIRLWGQESFESVLDALSKRTERGVRIGQIERWHREAAEASSEHERDRAERMLRFSIEGLPETSASGA